MRESVGVVDIGTNTVVLFVAGDPNDLESAVTIERFVRLGAGMSATGAIGREALSRLSTALVEFRAVLDRFHVGAVRAVGTSAARDASNAAALGELVEALIGVPLEVLTGAEEAEYGFRAALTGFRPADDTGRITVLDMGGGSTELVVGSRRDDGWRVDRRHSAQVGSIRFTERFFGVRPPDATVVAAAEAAAVMAFEEAGVRLTGEVASAGSLVVIDGLAAVLGTLEGVTVDGVGGGAVSLERLIRWRDRLLSLTPDQTLALAPDVMSGREDVVAMAAVILCVVCESAGFDSVVLRARSIRHGIAVEMLERNNSRVPPSQRTTKD